MDGRCDGGARKSPVGSNADYRRKRFGLCLILALLQSPHLRVKAVRALQQLLVTATFDNMPAVHDEYFIGIHDGG